MPSAGAQIGVRGDLDEDIRATVAREALADILVHSRRLDGRGRREGEQGAPEGADHSMCSQHVLLPGGSEPVFSLTVCPQGGPAPSPRQRITVVSSVITPRGCGIAMLSHEKRTDDFAP
jgi:hypothetical protein